MAERRRRVLWRTLLFALSLLAVATLAVLNRERQGVESCRGRFDAAAKLMQEARPNERNPLEGLANDPVGLRDHVYYNDFYRERGLREYNLYVDRERGLPKIGDLDFYRSRWIIGVCRCETPHRPLFQAPVRHVIIYYKYDPRADPNADPNADPSADPSADPTVRTGYHVEDMTEELYQQWAEVLDLLDLRDRVAP
jgi:hypothetical protein